jgi:hypothetical protein
MPGVVSVSGLRIEIMQEPEYAVLFDDLDIRMTPIRPWSLRRAAEGLVNRTTMRQNEISATFRRILGAISPHAIVDTLKERQCKLSPLPKSHTQR